MKVHHTPLLLALIMAAVTLLAGGMAITILYNTAFEEERARLIETASNQARIIEAVARFDETFSTSDHTEGATGATLSQVRDAHAHYQGLGNTGEFTLAKLENNDIVFLLPHRHESPFGTNDRQTPVPMESVFAEPMQRALLGQTGTMIGRDYRGEQVLAAYTPVAELDFGIVAKIDLAEIRAPFIRAALLGLSGAIGFILLGTLLFTRVTRPLTSELEKREAQVRLLLNSAGEGIYGLDLQGLTTFVNPAGARLLGYEVDELIGTPMHATVHHTKPDGSPYSKEECPIYAAFTDGVIHRADTEVMWRKDGTSFAVHYTSTPVWEDKQLAGAVVMFQDISIRKHMQDELQALTTQLLTVQDEERRRIARDLHDDSNQQLALLAIELEVLARNPPSSSEVLAEKLKSLNSQVAKLSDGLRTMAYQLHPSILDDLGLAAAVRACVEGVEKREGLHVTFTGNNIPPQLPPDIASCLYRIAQESLRNALKHGPCSHVEVELSGSPSGIELVVKDSGPGFTSELRKSPNSGLGLLAMKERARLVHGTFSLESQPGHGTTVRVWVPFSCEPV